MKLAKKRQQTKSIFNSAKKYKYKISFGQIWDED